MKKEENKLGQEPAFPTDHFTEKVWREKNSKGMSKRFYAACAAMQGLYVAAYSSEWMNKGFVKAAQEDNCMTLSEYIAKQAFSAADELLKQENQ